jgi:hypothetical protein
MRKFIEDLKEQCRKHNVKLRLTKGKNILCDGFFVSGFFDGETLACASGRDGYIYILVHESCHLDQFLENQKLWNKIEKMPDIDSWLSGKKIKNVNKAIEAYKWLELDCEKRTIKKLKKYKIPFTTEQIQKANSYVQFYNYIRETRKWCKKNNTPYNNKNVYSVMPKKFMPLKWYESMPDYVRQTFIDNKI